MRRFGQVTEAVVGIGSIAPPNSLLFEAFDTSLVTDASAARALLVDPLPPEARKAARVRRPSGG